LNDPRHSDIHARVQRPHGETRTIFASLICALALIGCNKPDESAVAARSASSPPIGVVDLDRVGRAMGWQDEAQKNLQATEAELKRVIESRLHAVQNTFEQKKKDIGNANNLTAAQITALNDAKDKSDLVKLGLTDKQIDDLIQASNAVQSEAAQSNAAFQQFMQQRRLEIQSAYRQAISPAVRRVAVANGRTAVFEPLPGLIYSDPANDLTDKVIDDLQKSAPIKVALPEVPHGLETTTTIPSIPTTQPQDSAQ
jgi:Skp family chaperone for outer membrane proteins